MKKILQMIGLVVFGIAAVVWIFQKGAFYGIGTHVGVMSVVEEFDEDPCIDEVLNTKSYPFMVRVGVKYGINFMHKKIES